MLAARTKIFQKKFNGARSDRNQVPRLMAVFVRRGVLVGTRLDRREFLFVKAMVALPARQSLDIFDDAQHGAVLDLDQGYLVRKSKRASSLLASRFI